MAGEIRLENGAKIGNVAENNDATEMLVLDEDGLVGKQAVPNVLPTLQDVTNQGAITTSEITTYGYYVNDGLNTKIIASEEGTLIAHGVLQLRKNNASGIRAFLNAELLTIDRNQFFPDKSGTIALLNDIAVENPTATPLSLATLNSTYPTQPTGFKVICPTINIIYIKASLTTWQSINTTTVT